MHPFVRASSRGQLHHTKRPPFFHPPSRHLRRFSQTTVSDLPSKRIGVTRAQTAPTAEKYGLFYGGIPGGALLHSGEKFPAQKKLVQSWESLFILHLEVTIRLGKGHVNSPSGKGKGHEELPGCHSRGKSLSSPAHFFSAGQCWEWCY